ncbi:DnaJ -like protein subfamily C member 7 [Halotydeus destructor]|nr:DnaJ -like protein subfamily C member 7 [Halotydeus destructor]
MYDEAVADWETVCETNSSASSKSYLETARKLMNEVKREPFAILGISATAPADQIKQARNRLALIHHPDKHQTEAAPIRRMHERKFKAVQEAFNAMMNCEAKATEPKMRESYYYPREEPKAEANKPPVYGDDCQVYVTGFDDELTEAELEKKMADHGRVISVKIRSVVKSRRYAFVTFAKAENALKVQSKLISFNGMKLTIRPKRATANDDTRSETSDHGYESKPRHDSGVDYSDDPMVSRGSRVQYRDYPNEHHVWIGLGSRGQHITETDLKTTLGQFGPLVGVSLKELQTGVKFAFATFAKASDARKALNRQVMCKGVPLRIEKKTEPNSRTAGGDRTFTSSRFDFDDHDIGEEW